MQSFFSAQQLLPLCPAILFLISSIILLNLGKEKWSIVILFFGSLMLGVFVALLDPFLVLWDEQYHALVAKNMIEHPLMPMLYVNPILDYDYRNWLGNHIWLHKQPLFLWQMAVA